MVESIRIVNGEKSIERRLYFCSFESNACKFGEAVRGHWGVETPLHWTHDVTFGEDDRSMATVSVKGSWIVNRRCITGFPWL